MRFDAFQYLVNDMGNETGSSLSAAEMHTLRHIAGIMIPADPAYGVPAASDTVILDDIVASLGRDLDDVRAAISLLADKVAGADAETAIRSFLSAPSRPSAALSRAVLQCYYRDERVLRSLGHDVSAPYPRGNVVEQGDWSLLDGVRSRAPLWRDDRGE